MSALRRLSHVSRGHLLSHLAASQRQKEQGWLPGTGEMGGEGIGGERLMGTGVSVLQDEN